MARSSAQVKASHTQDWHGGANQAVTHGNNRKTDKRYDARAVDYAKMMEDTRKPGITHSRFESGGYHKPGSRKKVH